MDSLAGYKRKFEEMEVYDPHRNDNKDLTSEVWGKLVEKMKIEKETLLNKKDFLSTAEMKIFEICKRCIALEEAPTHSDTDKVEYLKYKFNYLQKQCNGAMMDDNAPLTSFPEKICSVETFEAFVMELKEQQQEAQFKGPLNRNNIFMQLHKLVEHIVLFYLDPKELYNLRLVSKKGNKMGLEFLQKYFKGKFEEKYLLKQICPYIISMPIFLSDPHHIINTFAFNESSAMGLNRLLQTFKVTFPDHYWMILWGLYTQGGTKLLNILLRNEKENNKEILFESFKQGLETEKNDFKIKINRIEDKPSNNCSLYEISKNEYKKNEENIKNLTNKKQQEFSNYQKFINEEYKSRGILETFNMLETYYHFIFDFNLFFQESISFPHEYLNLGSNESPLAQLEEARKKIKDKKIVLEQRYLETFSEFKKLYGETLIASFSDKIIEIFNNIFLLNLENQYYGNVNLNYQTSKSVILSIEKTQNRIGLTGPDNFFEKYKILIENIEDIVKLNICLGCLMRAGELSRFYKKLLDVFVGNGELLNTKMEENKLANLLRKFMYLHNKYFYKEVARALSLLSDHLKSEMLKKMYFSRINTILEEEHLPRLQGNWSELSIQDAQKWFANLKHKFFVFSCTDEVISIFHDKMDELIRLTPSPYAL